VQVVVPWLWELLPLAPRWWLVRCSSWQMGEQVKTLLEALGRVSLVLDGGGCGH